MAVYDRLTKALVRWLAPLARAPMAAWILGAVLAIVFFRMLLPREWFEAGSQEPPNSVLQRAFRDCSVGQVYSGLKRDHPSWEKYRQDPIKEQCALGAQEYRNARSGTSTAEGTCKHGPCQVPLLRSVKPCANRDNTKCCDGDGKNCVDKRYTADRWSTLRRARVRRSRAGRGTCPDGRGWGWDGNAGLCCKLDSNGANTNTGCIQPVETDENDCPPFQVWDGKKCVCNWPLYLWDGSKCICNNQDPGYWWNEGSGRCECAAGYKWENNRCVLSS